MDDLPREFLTETGEHLDTVDRELVRFEQEPNDEAMLGDRPGLVGSSVVRGRATEIVESRLLMILDVDSVLAPGAQTCAA
jgi:hypothetical protein